MNRLAMVALTATSALVVSAQPASASTSQVKAAGVFGESAGAYSYNSTFVPSGSSAKVHAVYTASGKTIVTLQVRGLVPNREYGSHVHKFACGADPLAAGGHFQYVVGGASDPNFANEENEIWL